MLNVLTRSPISTRSLVSNHAYTYILSYVQHKWTLFRFCIIFLYEQSVLSPPSKPETFLPKTFTMSQSTTYLVTGANRGEQQKTVESRKTFSDGLL